MYNLPVAIVSIDDFKRKREAAGLSQTQASEALGMAREAVNRIENGVVAITHRTAVQAAVTFAMISERGGANAAAGVPAPARPGRPPAGVKAVDQPANLDWFFLMDDTPIDYSPVIQKASGGTLYKAEKLPRQPGGALITGAPRGPRLTYVRSPAPVGFKVMPQHLDAVYDPTVAQLPIPTQAQTLPAGWDADAWEQHKRERDKFMDEM